MARWALLEKAFVCDQLLPAGTVIGYGTLYPYEGAPGPHFAPLDDEARAMVVVVPASPVPAPSAVRQALAGGRLQRVQ